MDDFGPGLIVIIIALQVLGALFGKKKKKEKQKEQEALENASYSNESQSNDQSEDKKSESPLKGFFENISEALNPEVEQISVPQQTQQHFEYIDESEDEYEAEVSVENENRSGRIYKPSEFQQLKTEAQSTYSKQLQSNKQLQDAMVLSTILGPCKAKR